jgi:hypothetical protein
MNWLQPPRMQVVWHVLDAARDTGDKLVIDACVRLIDADRRGRKHHDPKRLAHGEGVGGGVTNGVDCWRAGVTLHSDRHR